MLGRLIEREGGRPEAIHGLSEGTTTIGRAADNVLVVDRAGVSRHHAELRWDGSQFVLADLDSKNGTWVNGQRLTAPYPLRHGDVLTLPGQPVLRFLFEEITSTTTVDLGSVLAAASQAATREATGETEAKETELRIDRRTAEVWVRDQRVNLTAKEYLALTVLAAAEGGLVSKQQLAEQVWPEYEGIVGDENVEQVIFRLRHKLETEPNQPHYLETIRRLGYRLHIH